jgi:myo-inositol 2-dehydrogenase/D-chiro-inositol 1-dehydrogenase
MMTVRIGVIGAGMIGTYHVTRITHMIAGGSVTAVFDPITERAEAAALIAGCDVRPSWRAVVDDPAVDAVLVASPGELHPEQSVACVRAGKPVLCEKPLALSAAGALDVVRAEVAAGRRLVQVGFMRRFDPGYLELRGGLAAGTIGEPLLAHAVHRNAVAPEFFRGEMALTDSVVHEFDAFRWLFGSEIGSVTVLAVKPNPDGPTGVRDPQLVLARFTGGELVTIESFVNCGYGYDVRCEVVGSRGTLSLTMPRNTVLRKDFRGSEQVPGDWLDRFGAAYTAQLQAWVDGVAQGRATGPSAWDGYAAAAAARAAVESSVTGGPVDVALNDRPAPYDVA